MGNTMAAGTEREDCVHAGMSAAWYRPARQRGERVIFYSHGGGFASGSRLSHANIASHLAAASGHPVLVYDYRLAPEHIFPAAVDDGHAAYRALLHAGHAPENIIFAGDSAGGTLTLALLLKLRDEGSPLPRAAIANCPWVDFESRHPSLDWKGDPFLTRPLMHYFADAALPDKTSRAALSLSRRDYRGLPPIYLLIGGKDPLFDEEIELAGLLRAAGNTGHSEIWEDMPHVWQGLAPFIVEAGLASERMAEFIDGC